MAWWTQAVPRVENYTDEEILVEYSHLRGSNGGLTFPDGFRQMLSDLKWGMSVSSFFNWDNTINAVKVGLKKGPVVMGFWDKRVGGHHAVVVHDYISSMKTGTLMTFMDPNGGSHTKIDPSRVVVPGYSTILGYLK
jgi:hypothetical protein